MIRKAKISDVPSMLKLINEHADRGEMLHRSLNDLYENLRDYIVIEEGGRILGCCALHIAWSDLAEIKSLVVDDEVQSRGYGTQLLKKCLEDAKELGVPKVFALTYKPEFFKKNGFMPIEKSELQHKKWRE